MCQFPLLDSTESLLIHYMFSEVFPFLLSHKNSVSKLLEVALAQCKSAGPTYPLPQTLPDIIFGKYEALVRSAPWDRQPTTMKLKQIYANLRVRVFCGLPLLC